MAGFIAAHAIWCVSDGEILVPIVATSSGGKRVLNRLVHTKLEEAVGTGREWLETNPHAAQRQVLVYDGFVTLPTGRTDALFVDARLYLPTIRSVSFVIPYRNAASPLGFAVHKPKLAACDAATADLTAIVESFFSGVDEHEKGAEVWNKHLDQSV